MEVFRRALAAHRARSGARSWVYVPYDQLTADVGPLASLAPEAAGIVLVESPAKAARRPYHRQKLALVLANQRHFAIEQAARGVAVRYVVGRDGYANALRELARELGPLRMMEAAERELREELAPLAAEGRLVVEPHAGFLTTRADFDAATGGAPPYRLDAFYKHMRAKTGLLMDGKKPVGGRWSFDVENRKAWRGDPPAPTPPRFRPDEITEEVGALVRERFADHPGVLDLETLPATADDAAAVWQWALRECLPMFGPFEDAMSTRSSGLFHTRISPLLNLHRLLPARVVADVAARSDIPLASREGFVRQILGWRELVRHVHVATDGFRRGAEAPGVGPSTLDAHAPLVPAFWGTRTGLACLDRVVADVWREGYSHHITRLMILVNLATLLALEPREVSDWFWVAYIDAYDWVVEPNVLAMATYAAGDVMTTKPYVSGAAYIAKMSDYCQGCAFDPKSTCPVTRLYWAFLARHADRFAKNPRVAGPVASVKKRSAIERAEDARVFERAREVLGRGELLTPASLVRRADR
ncbi:MAG: cryptochrome/photolyase family protein [Polyangiaceae bacterium]